MKKMKNGFLKKAVLGMGIVLLLLAGCSNEPKDEPKVTKETHDAKSNELIKFNISNAKYLATQWAKQTNKNGRSAESEALDSLIALVPETDAEGNPVTDANGDVFLEEVDAMEVPKEELKLADWCILQPVREVYTCPYSLPPSKKDATGVYTVFACYIDWWQYTDGTPAPGLSMLMYVKPDGSTIDVLNLNGKVNYFLTTWIKENDGEDYLQFDQNGNLFMLAKDDSTGEFIVFCYNPLSDVVDTYKLNLGTKKIEIRNFTVTKDGQWIFLNVMEDDLINNVYAMPVDASATPIAMYTYEPEEKPTEPTWAVSTISFNPNTNKVYWYVDEYNDSLRPTSGLYVADKISGGYSKDAVTRHAAIGWWDFISVLETKASGNLDGTIPKPANPDYKAVIDYLMNAGGYDRSKYQFDLSYFKDKKDVTIVNWNGEEEKRDFSILYEKTKNLKDEELLQYLVDTPYKDVYGYPDWWVFPDPDNGVEGSIAEDGNKWVEQWVIGSVLTSDFFMQYWCQPYDEPIKDAQGNYEKDAEGNFKTNHLKAGAGGYAKAGYSLPFNADGIYIQPVFPFDVFIHDKDGKSFDEGTIDETYLKSMLSRNYNGIILSNDDGTWLLNDVWSEKTDDNEYALAFKLTDKNGNFVCTQPDGLDKLLFKPRWSKDYERDETDPWYKKPFATNSKGIAALAQGGKTIYYHSGNETVDLLKNYNGPKLSLIYSFNLYEDTCVCNGVKEFNGGYVMLSIDLTSGKVTKLPLEKKVESMLSL